MEQMVGQRVRWSMQFQADVISRISEDKSPWEIMGHNMALEAPFGAGDDWDEMKGLVWVMSASRQEEERNIHWTEMVWGIPPGEEGFTLAPPGDYEIYFQHQIDPESLYKGDKFTLEDNGVKITLRKQTGGNYNIRKIK